MGNNMSKSTHLVKAAIEAFTALQEYPFSAFNNIEIQRFKHAGDVKTCYRLTALHPKFEAISTISMDVEKGAVVRMMACHVVQLPEWQGPVAATITYTPTLEGRWVFNVGEVGRMTDDNYWFPNINMEGQQFDRPAKATYDSVNRLIMDVAQRMMTRLSRVDLL